MDNTVCQCQHHKTRRYLKSPDDLTAILKSTNRLVENGLFILNKDSGADTKFLQKEYSCSKCGSKYVLQYNAVHNSGSFGIKSNITSEHLIKLDQFCRENQIAELYRGGSLYDDRKPGEWVYFDCYFNAEKIRARFNFPDTIKYHEYDGLSAGQESGFVDELTNDAVLGNHPNYGKRGNKKKLG